MFTLTSFPILKPLLDDPSRGQELVDFLNRETELYVEIELTSAQLVTLFERLEQNKSIRFLDLGNVSLDFESASALAKLLNRNVHLKQLTLNCNDLGEESAQVLFKVLEENSILTRLAITGFNTKPIFELLTKALIKNKTLRSLILKNILDIEYIDLLNPVIESHQSLTQFELRNSFLKPKAEQKLAEALRKNKNITSVILFNILRFSRYEKRSPFMIYSELKYLDNNEMDALIRSLTDNVNLTSLDLSGNFEFDSKSIQTLALGLRNNSSLAALSLDGTRFSDTDLYVLCNALNHNKTLRSLSLSCCNLERKRDIKALAKMLETNQSLTELVLTHNRIGDVGAEILLKAIEKNGRPIKIVLGPNNLPTKNPEHFLSKEMINRLELPFDIAQQRIIQAELAKQTPLPEAVMGVVQDYLGDTKPRDTKDPVVESLAQKYIARAEGKQEPLKPEGLLARLLDYLTRFWNWITSFVRPKEPVSNSIASDKMQTPPAVLPKANTLAVESQTEKISEPENLLQPDKKGPKIKGKGV